ncbi:hypothetical protein [Flavivirga jejuensis]|uniref:Uncharacterized protein n=1 Tax=Flavivirga jejuensis TaxID=870487 RepID=A0ABT8WVM3_9FLAO|nr:hypothetical protein [Flavivirga jejuensis]MDO5976946.1 hypothetical protein [Flavivirga jejuensis]
MKKVTNIPSFIVFAISAILCLISIGYHYTTEKDVIAKQKKIINNHTIAIEALNLKYNKIDSLPVNRNEYLTLYDKYAKLQNNYLNLNESLNEVKDEWYFTIFKVWGSFGAFIGVLLAFFGFKEMTKRITVEKIADIVGENQKDLKHILENKLTNKKLRTKNSFCILNQHKSVFNPGFIRVMKLFGVNVKKNKVLTNINGLDTIGDVLIEKIKKHKVLIIENQSLKNGSRWELPKFYGDFEKLKEDITKLEANEDVDDKKLKKLKNYKSLVDLSNKICDTTSIIYYGQAGVGNFPSDLVKPDLQHKITFANAPAQLYGNINNQLQFIHELEK